jgi:hypothetical protein
MVTSALVPDGRIRAHRRDRAAYQIVARSKVVPERAVRAHRNAP